MTNPRSRETDGDHATSQNGQRYEDLARENREGHRRVEQSLREAERIAKDSRPARSSMPRE